MYVCMHARMYAPLGAAASGVRRPSSRRPLPRAAFLGGEPPEQPALLAAGAHTCM